VKVFIGPRRQWGAWNPLGGRPMIPARIKALATQRHVPATGIEENQGALYDRSTQEALDIPQDLGVNVTGFVNPYSLTFYSYGLSTSIATRVVPPNIRRTYLILQNQGPGNIWINFGQDVTIATAAANSNGMQLIETQIYEQIGGGYMDANGRSITNCFISPDYISCITDTADTTILVGEGVWRPSQAAGQSDSGYGY
jgi:hypothetical protein